MKIGLYAHGGSGNHGCEAIVRSTAGLLGQHEYTLLSERPQDDLRYGLDKIFDVVPSQNDMPSGIGRLAYSLQMSLRRDDILYWRRRYREFSRKASGLDLALSVGGDNYCYSGFAERFAVLNRSLVRRGIPIVLWGCSIDEDRLCPAILEDLRRYSLIVARESLTFNTLLNAGLDNVRLMPDTAFLLEAEEPSFPRGLVSGDLVGLNISPLVIRKCGVSGGVMKACRALIDFILGHTDMGVMLIPHVVWEGNDDREPLKTLFGEYSSSGRVVMAADADAMALKGVIKHCRFMVAARTHASIAAYSEAVPTLVLGYSVKSKGIATDLFGTAENYVLPVEDIKGGEELVRAFKWLMENENGIRSRYGSVLPSYKGGMTKDILDEWLLNRDGSA